MKKDTFKWITKKEVFVLGKEPKFFDIISPYLPINIRNEIIGVHFNKKGNIVKNKK